MGQTVDARADLYSLGVIMYELITGKLPFIGEEPLSIISQHIHAPVIPPRDHNEEIPPELNDLIVALLSKTPQDRPESASAVLEILNKIDELETTSTLPAATIETEPADEPVHNLPFLLTSFIGREQEINEIKAFFEPVKEFEAESSRLLTVTGPGGTGKTRLALQCAYRMLEFFEGGIWLVDLVPQSDPALVPQTVAAVLGIHEEQNRPVLTTLAAHLRSRRTLLILDSCEHLIEACAQFAEYLLVSCPNLYILATSREALSIPGEVNLQLEPLSLPDCEIDQPLEEFEKYEAIALFIERAKAAVPGFSLTRHNLLSVVQACCRLDGIPLAIELAAAQVKLLRVEQLADRLEDRFLLLKGGSRTALPRQQTLEALIAWSYDLLSPSERVMFQRLSVFVGGWTLEAAEAICADEVAGDALESEGDGVIHPAEVLDLLTQLVNKSLVVVGRRLGEDTRYRYLETIRQYAYDRCLESGEIDGLRRRHRDWYLDFVERAEVELRGVNQTVWLEKLELEHDNIRSALRWILEREIPEEELQSEEAEAGLRMVGALRRFWDTRGYVSEGRKWLDRALESNSLRTTERVKALIGAGELASRQSDGNRGLALFEESLALSHELGYRPGVAETLFCMQSLAEMEGWTSKKKEALIQESLGIWREIGDRRGIATALGPLATMALDRFDYDQATALFEESLGLFRELGDEREIAGALWNLGEVTLRQGDYASAQNYYEESLALYQALKDKHGIATQMRCLGEVARNQGDLTEAKKLFDESIPIFQEIGDKGCRALAMHGLGLAELNGGDEALAIQLGEEVLAAFREMDWKMDVALALDLLGRAYYTQGDISRASQLFDEGLNLACGLGHASLEISFLEDLARTAHAGGDHKRAAQLFGASHAWREAINTPMPAGDQAEFEAVVIATRENLSQQVFVQEWQKGEDMLLENAEKIFELARAANNLID
jgi:non-specific serine/threonine protein kinase